MTITSASRVVIKLVQAALLKVPWRICFLLFYAITLSSAYAATFTVTTANISGPGSLPVVVIQANASSGNLIQFAVTNPIILASQLPTFTNSVTINGRTDVPTIISGAGSQQIFTFASGTTNILSNLQLVNGYTAGSGAAINNAGTLYLSACTLSNNLAPNVNGGAVYNSGFLVIVSSLLIGNSSGSGGALYNDGTVTIDNTSLLNNQARTGGAVYSTSFVTVQRTTVSGNQAMLGGGIYSAGVLQANNSTVSSNLAIGGSGQNGGDGILYNNWFSYTGAGGGGGGGAGAGGGFFIATGSINYLTNCTISLNQAIGGSGGNGGKGAKAISMYAPSTGSGGNGGSGGGLNAGGGGAGETWAGVKAYSGSNGGKWSGGGGGGGTVTSFNNGNGGSGGFGGGDGGFGISGGLTAPQHDNYVGLDGQGGGGGAGMGGGIFTDGGMIATIYCTVAANNAVGGTAGSGWNGIPAQAGRGVGGGIYQNSGLITLFGSIIAQNSAAVNGPDLSASVISSGYNLIGNNQNTINLSIFDFQNVAASLGPLQNNGGPTFTCAILPGSPAIGNGTSVGAPTTDQRGIARPPGAYDIGAFQLQTLVTPTITWTNPADIIWGAALGANQLNASVGVAGTLTYTPPAGTILAAGNGQTLSVVFTPADPTQYTSATNTVTINVQKASQAITFNPLPNHLIGDPAMILSASSSSGLPVTLSLLSGPANLTGSLLSLGGNAGWITISATQTGNTNYNAAPEVDQSFYLGVLPLPVISTPPVGQSVYPGGRVSLFVIATNGPLSYQWQFNNANIPSATSSNLVLSRVQAGQSGAYRVIASNSSGSTTSSVANLTIIISAGTPQIATQPQSQTIRVGETATLSVTATGNATLQYQWFLGNSGNTNGIIAGATSATYPATGLLTNTSFWVSISNSLGTVDSATATVVVLPAKTARLKMGSQYGLAALVIDGLPGTTYQVECSTNLISTNWTTIISFVLPSSPYTFLDTGSPVNQRRYYRAVAQ